ncbi:MAG: hypothetical protein AB7F43_09545 [Bacteriovoracia bacterium]
MFHFRRWSFFSKVFFLVLFPTVVLADTVLLPDIIARPRSTNSPAVPDPQKDLPQELRYETRPEVPNRVFIPKGFDNNDIHVQVVTDWMLPSTCHRLGKIQVLKDIRNRRVVITSNVNVYTGCVCIKSIQRKHSVIDLDMFEIPDDYDIVFIDKKGDMKSMGLLHIANVADTTKPGQKVYGPDNFPYAPVSDLFIDTERKVALIQGKMDACLSIKEVRVSDPYENIIEVLPIIKEPVDQSLCGRVQMPFSEEIKLPEDLSGRFLVYVRSGEGQSIAKVDSFDGI